MGWVMYLYIPLASFGIRVVRMMLRDTSSVVIDLYRQGRGRWLYVVEWI